MAGDEADGNQPAVSPFEIGLQSWQTYSLAAGDFPREPQWSARRAGVERMLFASTCSVYGATEETLDERSISKPISLYGHTKLASERVLLSMASDTFAPTILRFATIYGLSGRTRFDLVVNLLTAKAKIEGKITVFGGDQWRPFVHVDDAALAVATALAAPREIVANQIFNVGSNDQNYTIQTCTSLRSSNWTLLFVTNNLNSSSYIVVDPAATC